MGTRREIDAVLERAERARTNFLCADIELGLTFCHLAKRAEDHGSYNRRLQLANRVLEVCCESIWKVKLKPHDLDQLTAKVELLRLELESVDQPWCEEYKKLVCARFSV